MTFQNFHVNSGNTFDISTGTFTAPVSGIYEFAFSGNTASDYSCCIQIYKNGNNKLHSIYTRGGQEKEPYANLASSWIVSLDTGDTIRLKVYVGKLYSDGSAYRILTGKLLEITS